MNFIFICIIFILIHHYCIHKNDKKTLINKIFQYEDINNHETFIILLLGIWIGKKLNIT